MPYRDPIKALVFGNKYKRERTARIRSDYFCGKSCVDCGSTEDLVIHHEDPSIKVNHRVFSWSSARRDAELEKCIVLCDSCHRKRHGEKPLIHGTLNAYWHKKCRCAECKQACAIYMAEYKARTLTTKRDHVQP